MDYQIAIPSYSRAELLKHQTIAFLERYNVDPARVTVFVANEEESNKYRYALGNKYKIVIGLLGKVNQQRFYHDYYPKGTPLLNLDDDTVTLRQRTADGKLEDFNGSIDELVKTGFDICKQEGAKMWGINPVENGFFMSDSVTVGLRYICGNFYGNYAGDLAIMGKDRIYAESSGDDFETTLRSFIQNGSVVRFEYICPKTKYFAAGGIDAELKQQGINNRQDEHSIALANIVSRYPELATLTTKAGGVTNIRLKTITYKKIPKAHAQN
jgi:hypothetical protein